MMMYQSRPCLHPSEASHTVLCSMDAGDILCVSTASVFSSCSLFEGAVLTSNGFRAPEPLLLTALALNSIM